MIRRLGLTSSMILFVCLALMALGSSAFAQDKAEPKGAQKKEAKRTTINFEDQLVEGQAQKPDLFFLQQPRDNKYKRMIKLRENFLPEMHKTSEEVGRPGSGSKGSRN